LQTITSRDLNFQQTEITGVDLTENNYASAYGVNIAALMAPNVYRTKNTIGQNEII
jgi:hypothetical protein